MFAFTIDSPDPRVRVEIHQDESPEAPYDMADWLSSVSSGEYVEHVSSGETRPVSFAGYSAAGRHDPEDAAEAIRNLRFDGYSVIPYRFEDYGSGGCRLYECEPENANGILYASRDRIATAFVKYGYSWPKARQWARRAMRAELGELRAWAEGNVYGFVILEAHEDDSDDEPGHGELIGMNSCWGFYEPDMAYWRNEYGYVGAEALSAAKEATDELDAEAANRADAAARDIQTV